jgi:hypothetical protein
VLDSRVKVAIRLSLATCVIVKYRERVVVGPMGDSVVV